MDERVYHPRKQFLFRWMAKSSQSDYWTGNTLGEAIYLDKTNLLVRKTTSSSYPYIESTHKPRKLPADSQLTYTITIPDYESFKPNRSTYTIDHLGRRIAMCRVCRFCKKSFKRRRSTKRHEKYSCKKTPERVYCKVCNKSWPSFEGLLRHQHSGHTVQTKMYLQNQG